MGLIKAYKTKATIEGLSKKVTVSIEVEDDELDTSYWYEVDAKETFQNIEKGIISCLWVKVTARFSDLDHFEGVDTLGQVLVRSSIEGFKKDILQTVECQGMVSEAIESLVASVLQGKESIDNFLTKERL